MSSQNDLGFYSLLVSPAAGISAFVAIDLNSDGSITPSFQGRGMGVTQEGAVAGRYVNVKLWSAPGTHELTVSPGWTITPGVQYTVSGGYVIATNASAVTPTIEAFQAGVSAAGIVLEFNHL
jgi:hypothetical protein